MKRQTAPQNRPSPTQQKKQQQGFESVGAPPRKPSRVVSPGERTVKRLKLSKALTIPDTTTVADACRRMATRRVDAALLTDSNAILCGIITDKANSGTCQWWSMARWWHC
jgi:signal-transduction protein with cAMP-binding, CBS, and nucleotidyltransferase domain